MSCACSASSFTLALAILFSPALPAQNSIEGTVLSDRTGLPLRRAHVILKPAQPGLNAPSVDTDDKGAFAIRDVEPGRYSLSATRDGYVASSSALLGKVMLPQIFGIGAKESIVQVTFRLRPFAVMFGRVSLDDGEPAMSVRVEVYREYRNHLRHGYTLAGTASTNDRGEYRMFGLTPGSYTVAASSDRAPAVDEHARDAQALRYTTTFYPRSTKLSEAVPVRLDYGQEIGGIDVLLARGRKVKIHGRVTSGVTGELVPASLSLQRVDGRNTASIAIQAPATFDHDLRFEIRDVAPESYILWAEGGKDGKTLVGHTPVTVGETDVDNVELKIEGAQPGSAVLVVDGAVRLPDSVHLRFEPRSERGKIVEAQKQAGLDGFQFSLMGSDLYDMFVIDLPNDFYLSAVRVNGADALPYGIQGVAASAARPFEAVLDARGGRVSGRVLGSDNSVLGRASVALIPDPPKGRVQFYREGSADENGLFVLRGVAPGKYILVAWLDDPPCEFYDPEGLAGCRSAGISVEVQQSGEQNVEVKVAGARKSVYNLRWSVPCEFSCCPRSSQS